MSKENKKGFTLIELIVVLAILGILMLILIPSFLGYSADAQEISCRSNRTNIQRLYKFSQIKDSSKNLTKYLTSIDGENNIANYKCPIGGVYSVDVTDPYHVLCSKHDDDVETPGNGGSSGNINGTDLTHNNIQNFNTGDKVPELGLSKGTIITIDGQQYIVKTELGSGNTISETSAVMKLTTDKAIDKGDTYPSDSNGRKKFYDDIKALGTKIKYNGQYYVKILESGIDDYPNPVEKDNMWLPIKGS